MKKKLDILSINPKWKTTTIKLVSEYVQRGKSPKYEEGINEYPVLNQKCIHWEKINYDYIKFLTKTFWDDLENERFLQSGDILWNSTGTGTIGRASIFFPNKIKKITADGHITIIRTKKNYNPLFLFYYIASPYVQTDIEIIFSGSTDQVELNLPTIETTVIPDIDKKEQDKIVEKINDFYKNFYKVKGALVEINEKKIKGKLEKLEKKFLLDIFK